MAQKTQNQFLSHTIYQDLIPKDSPFRVLNTFVDWPALALPLANLYHNESGGNSNYPLVMMIKGLFVQKLYGASDREMEEIWRYRIDVKYFLGLEIQSDAPDHSTFSRFRNLIIQKKGATYFEHFFDTILKQIIEAGMEFGALTNLDSTIVNANVNTMKEKMKKDKARKEEQDTPVPRDYDASWTAKSRPKTDREGNKYQQTTYYYGYKAHVAVNENDVITSLISLPAGSSDNTQAMPLLRQTLSKKIQIIYAGGDKGYEDAILIKLIEEEGMMSVIKTKRTRILKGEMEHIQAWEDYAQNPEREEQQKKRGFVERPFADMKQNHGFGRCQYLGLAKFKMQAFLTASVHNLKIAIKSFFGISFHLA